MERLGRVVVGGSAEIGWRGSARPREEPQATGCGESSDGARCEEEAETPSAEVAGAFGERGESRRRLGESGRCSGESEDTRSATSRCSRTLRRSRG